MTATTVPFVQPIDMRNLGIKNLADPAAATDAVTKQYADALVRGLDWKASARAAPTATVTVVNPGTAIFDGVTAVAGDRLLLMSQTAAAENGLYVFNGSAAALTRATDADVSAEVTAGMAVTVAEGTINGDKVFLLTTNDPIVLGTTALVFAQLGGGSAAYTAGNGLNLSGGQFSVVPGAGVLADGTSTRIDPSVVTRKFAATIGDGSTTDFTVTHSLGSTDITVAVWDITADQLVYAGVGTRLTNSVHVAFATAPAANSYRVVVHG